MVNKSKSKGTRWETAIVNWLNELHIPSRRLVLGGRDDHGDIILTDLPILIQAKYRTATATVTELRHWCMQAWEQSFNYRVHHNSPQAPCPVVVVKTPRKSSPADALWLCWSYGSKSFTFLDGYGFQLTLDEHWIHYVPFD